MMQGFPAGHVEMSVTWDLSKIFFIPLSEKVKALKEVDIFDKQTSSPTSLVLPAGHWMGVLGCLPGTTRTVHPTCSHDQEEEVLSAATKSETNPLLCFAPEQL